jgi:hypothetical protein
MIAPMRLNAHVKTKCWFCVVDDDDDDDDDNNKNIPFTIFKVT